MAKKLVIGIVYAHELGFPDGHVACTLGGVNYESRGDHGIVKGRSARGATSRLFRHRFYIVLSDTAAMRAKRWADAQVGEPYRYGQVPGYGGDCSGYVSGIICKALNRPVRRLFSTEDWTKVYRQLGFKPGTGPWPVPEDPRPATLVHIHRMKADGTVGAQVPGGSYRWSEGWTQARPYAVGGVPYLFLLKKGDGSVHVHRLNDDGTVGARIKDYEWSAGWTSVEFFSTGGKTYLLLLKEKGYGGDDKNVHIHVMKADGTVGAQVPGGSYRWSEGWTQARPYAVGGVPYLFLLKKGDGSVHVHRLNDDGTVGARIKDYEWSAGWTSVEFFSTGGKTYLLLLKEKGYGGDDKNVHIHVMKADGTVGAQVPGGSYRWSEGWTQARPYAVGGVPYLFLLKKGDGSVHVHRLNDDGTVGARIKDYEWSAGWTSVEFCSVPSGTYLLLLKDGQKADR